MPKQAPPRKKISLVQIRAQDIEPGDIVWLAKGPRLGAWRRVSHSVIISGAASRVDVPYTNDVGVEDQANYGPYDLVKLQIERDL